MENEASACSAPASIARSTARVATSSASSFVIGAPYGDRRDFNGRHADADRHVLPAFATGVVTACKTRVVADRDDLRHRIGTVADDGGVADRRSYFAVLDEVALGDHEDEIA